MHLCLKQWLLISGLGLVMAACTSTPPPPSQVPVVTAYPGLSNSVPAYPGPTAINVYQTPQIPATVPTPQNGQASLAGVFYSSTTKMIVPGTLIYLTPAVGPDKKSVPAIISGPNTSKGDIVGMSNDKAQFALTNIPPGNYYLVVASFNWVLAQKSPDATGPWLIELKQNQALSLGIVYVPWP